MAPQTPQPQTRNVAPQPAARPMPPQSAQKPAAQPQNPVRANVAQPPRPAPSPAPQPAPTTPQPHPNPQPSPTPSTPPSGNASNDPMTTYASDTILANSQPAGQMATGVDAEEIARQKRTAAAKKARAKREARLVAYPGLTETYTDEQGNTQTRKVVLQEVPTDYSADLHHPLKASEFNHRATFLLWKAQEFDRLANKARQDAEIARTAPAGASRSAAVNKKLAAMQAQIAVLRQQLEGSGVDVDAILRAAGLGEDQLNAAAQEEAQAA